MAPPRLLVIDGGNIVGRAYHVAAQGREGQSVYNLAVHGLRKMSQNLVRQVDPLRIVVALDSDTSFRRELFPSYKSHRSEKPEEFTRLMREVGNILADEIGAEPLIADGYEADDVVATVAQASIPYGWRVCVASQDKDILQLVCDLGEGRGVFCLHPDRGSYVSVGPAEVLAKKGVPPLRIPMFQALAGDAGDAVPGVTGIGPVTARRLANDYRTPSHLFADLHRLQRSDRTRLEAAGIEHLELMLALVTLRPDAPLRCPAPGV